MLELAFSEHERRNPSFVAEDFTESVLQLMQNEAMRYTMGAEARRFACSRDWNTVFENIYQIYDAALNAYFPS